ncbi:MAG: zf-HC2 domain-containing protein [Ruminococcaceae bacterium]|nr:zf-HC2 domain-containing protein [Oscillospiraceae bacterium]
MAIKCPIDDALLVDYLDDSLSLQARTDLDEHISRCPHCQARITAQRQWLALVEQSGLADTGSRMLDPSTLLRLQEQVKREIAAEPQTVNPPVRGGWRRPVFWLQAAGVAAAVVLLVFTFPLLLETWQRSRGAVPASRIESLDELAITGATTEAMYAAVGGESDDRLSVNDWEVYKGSLVDIPAMSCFFLKSETEEITVATTMTSGDLPTYDSGALDEEKPVTEALNKASDMTVANYFASSSRQLNQQGQELLSVLRDAHSLRIVARTEQRDQAAIIAAFSGETGERNASILRESMRACQTPVKIEIISQDELPLRLEQLDPGLYSRVFCEKPEEGMDWILIMIGA